MNEQMKTIKLQNCTGFEDYWFKIIVNGKEYEIKDQFLTIQVPDNNSYEIKVEYSLDGHPTTASSFVYTYNLKDNVLLQISKRRLTKTLISLIVGLILIFVLAYFYKNGRFITFSAVFPVLFLGIYQAIRKKKFLFIQEVPTSGDSV